MINEAQQRTATTNRRVVCELDASSRAEEVLGDALALCEEHGAELFVVWVLEPRLFGSPFPGSAGAVGTFGLPGVLHTAVERARERGIAATSAVRIGDREIVLRREAEALATLAMFRANGTRTEPTHIAETAVVRCPRCNGRYDERGVHFCPSVHLNPAA